MENTFTGKKPIFTGLATALLSITLVGCAATTEQTTADLAPVMQDYRINNATDKQALSDAQLAQALATADAVFVGEYHSHSASHLLQARLLQNLQALKPNLVLSMEQFSRDKQAVVNQYLNAEIGEQTLIKQGDAWPNYESDYRPLVEFAKAHNLPVIAANAPLQVVRCIGRKGPEIIEKFNPEQKTWVADDVVSSSEKYQQKFMQAMGGHGSHSKKDKAEKSHKAPKLSNSFYAQLSRDNTMAESIYTALQQNPGATVVHTNGAFHSDSHLGTVDALKRLDPSLKILVISPQFSGEDIDWSTGDYVYQIAPMPTRYVKKENQNKAIMAMMKKRKNNGCALVSEQS